MARNEFIFTAFLQVGRAKKRWAEKQTQEWRLGACDLSLRMLEDYLRKSVEEIAEETYAYIKMRASFTYGVCHWPIDPNAKSIWDALLKGNADPLFKHYRCYPL